MAGPLPRRPAPGDGYAGRFVAAWLIVAALAAGPWVALGVFVAATWLSTAGRVVAGVLGLLGVGATVCLSLLLASVLTRRRLLPLTGTAARIVACAAYRLVRRVGRCLGGTDEAFQRSFLEFQNDVALSWWDGRAPTRLLVLLPHCLEAGVRERVVGELGRYECTWRVVGGGSEALAAVKSLSPDRLIAVACERDLLHGILSVGNDVPWVYVLPNVRGETPCRSTSLDMDRFATVMAALAVPHSPTR